MVNITNVGSTVTHSPTDNNRQVNPDGSKSAESTVSIDPAKQPKFVDRRRNPDRRRQSRRPLLDTRRNRDRRRTSRLHIEI